MATKQQSYDHPAYEIPVIWSGDVATTTNAKSAKFVAFTSMLLKSATTTAVTMGTAGGTDAVNAFIAAIKISGTSTTTYNLGTFGSSGGGSSLGTFTGTNTAFATNVSLAQGDVIYALKGTDTALSASVSFEMYVLPGANLTV